MHSELTRQTINWCALCRWEKTQTHLTHGQTHFQTQNGLLSIEASRHLWCKIEKREKIVTLQYGSQQRTMELRSNVISEFLFICKSLDHDIRLKVHTKQTVSLETMIYCSCSGLRGYLYINIHTYQPRRFYDRTITTNWDSGQYKSLCYLHVLLHLDPLPYCSHSQMLYTVKNRTQAPDRCGPAQQYGSERKSLSRLHLWLLRGFQCVEWFHNPAVQQAWDDP